MNAKLRVAQIGVGGFGSFRRERMRETGLFDLVAAYDLDPEALARCREEDGAMSAHGYEELLASPEIEAVIISTGAKFHAEQIIQAAEHGLHVFVEKPLCATMDEAQALLEVQGRTGVVIGVGHTDHTSDAVSAHIKRMIDAGQLGRVAAFEATTAHSGGLSIKLGDWRGDPERNPGGMLFQCGVHLVHELIFYFGPVSKVSAMMRRDVHSTGTADVAVCLMEFASGVMGTLNAYHVTPYRHTLSLFGVDMNLYRDNRYFDEGVELLSQSVRTDGGQEPKVPVVVEGRGDDCDNLRKFYSAVREGGQPYPGLIDGARAVSVVFAAEESARTGSAVNVVQM